MILEVYLPGLIVNETLICIRILDQTLMHVQMINTLKLTTYMLNKEIDQHMSITHACSNTMKSSKFHCSYTHLSCMYMIPQLSHIGTIISTRIPHSHVHLL